MENSMENMHTDVMVSKWLKGRIGNKYYHVYLAHILNWSHWLTRSLSKHIRWKKIPLEVQVPAKSWKNLIASFSNLSPGLLAQLQKFASLQYNAIDAIYFKKMSGTTWLKNKLFAGQIHVEVNEIQSKSYLKYSLKEGTSG